MDISNRILAAREYAGLDISQASQAMSVNPSELVKWEFGEAEPPLEYLQKMCVVYGVSSDFLLLGNDPDGKYLPRCCQNCGAKLPKDAAFCPSCGKEAGTKLEAEPEPESEPGPEPETEPEPGLELEPESSPDPVLQPETYSIVLSLGTGSSERASEGIRLFYQSPEYCAGCSCPDGRLYDSLCADEVVKVISAIVLQLECGNPTFLCRGLSYDKAVEVIEIFHGRTNAFLFCDSDGHTLEELGYATPKLKYIVADSSTKTEKKEPSMWDKMASTWSKPKRFGTQQSTSQQTSSQPPIIIRQNVGGGCLAELLGLALILLIIVLVDSL